MHLVSESKRDRNHSGVAGSRAIHIPKGLQSAANENKGDGFIHFTVGKIIVRY